MVSAHNLTELHDFEGFARHLFAPLSRLNEAEPGVRTHGGFYFRWALGPGYVFDAVSSSAVGDATLNGFGLAGELLIGGTPAPGLVIGGGTHGANALAPRLARIR